VQAVELAPERIDVHVVDERALTPAERAAIL
jgi:hypothetical protein